MISLENVSKSFGKSLVLKALTFQLNEGERIVLTGPSGCGKSTLLKILVGLETPDSGNISIGGKKVSAANKIIREPAERGIGYIPQGLGLWPNLSVEQNIRLGRSVSPERVAELIGRLGLNEVARKKAGKLSEGEKQRVAFARAFLIKPQVLVLDEPFSNLDMIRRDDLYQWIDEFVGDEMILLTVTHDLADARALRSNRVIVLEGAELADDIKGADLQFSGAASETLRYWDRRR